MTDASKVIITQLINEIPDIKCLTDGDIEDIAEAAGVSYKDVSYFIHSLFVKGTPCEGCIHIEFRSSNMYPCNECNRIKRTDFYISYE